MAFRKAERTKLWARVAIYGPSGSGKSFTAMRIATGLAAKAGSRIAAIDTENRSLSKYADRFDFDVDDLGNRTIDTYLASINQCIKDGYKVLVIDSLSHAWKELLEEVDRIAAKSFSGNSWAAWAKGTPKQNKLIKAIVDFPGHLIVTMRSKTEWALDKDNNGKNTITRSGLSPEQGKGIEYEFDVLMDINQGHIAEIQKDRTGKYQDQIIEKPGEEFGEALFDWLNSGSAPPPPPPSTLHQQCVDGMYELKNIMLATADDGSRLFSDDEYNVVKATINQLVGKPDDECWAIISELLDNQKEQLQIRLDEWAKNKRQSKPAAIVTGTVEPETPSLADEFRKNKAATASAAGDSPQAETATAEADDGFVDDIPDSEGSELATVAAAEQAGELDIF